MKEYLFFYLGCYMFYSRDTRRREAGYRSPPQETESHKWINSCMSGLTHLFLWCAQTAVIFVPEISVGIFTNSPRFNSSVTVNSGRKEMPTLFLTRFLIVGMLHSSMVWSRIIDLSRRYCSKICRKMQFGSLMMSGSGMVLSGVTKSGYLFCISGDATKTTG